jgi:uncharacterized protein (DUF433 family)
MNTQATVLADRITSTPGVCGGKPCIAGTRIRVLDIYVMHELQGKTPDEIVRAYPHITLAEVHSALAYYYSHIEEISQSYRDEHRKSDELRAKLGPGPLEQRRTRVQEAPVWGEYTCLRASWRKGFDVQP